MIKSSQYWSEIDVLVSFGGNWSKTKNIVMVKIYNNFTNLN